MFNSKNLLAALFIASNAFVTLASAGHVSMSVGETRGLPSCGGKISVNNGGNNNQLNVVLDNIQDCSNHRDSAGNSHKFEQDKKLSYTIKTAVQSRSGTNTVRIVIDSNTGAHSDTIDVTYTVTGALSAHALELSRSGTINGYDVLAYFGGQTEAVFQARMTAICQSPTVGMNYAKAYSVKSAAYDGQTVLELKNGSWNTRTIKDASQAAVFSSLQCAY